MGGPQLDLIYVQGCARSGTTLLKQLIAAGHDGLRLLAGELDPPEALEQAARLPRGLAAVASRSYKTSLEMKRLEPRMGIVWLLRSPLDVLVSKHPNKRDRGPGWFYVSPSRWVRSIDLWRSWAHCPLVVTVRFEELIERPAVVQERISRRFGLRFRRPFERCHRHFDQRPENVTAMHSIRPLDSRCIDRARDDENLRRHLHTCFLENRALRRAADEAGYDSFNRLRSWVGGGPAEPPGWWKPAMAS